MGRRLLLIAALSAIATIAGIATIAALLTTSNSADASPRTWGLSNAGASYIGMCSPAWPCAESLKVFRGLPVKRVGWLGVTFGEECSCAREFLKLPGNKIARVHISNGTCFSERGRKCGKYEAFHGLSIAGADRLLRHRNPRILRRFRRALESTGRTVEGVDQETILYVSPVLESPFSRAARRVTLQATRRRFPAARLVDNPMGEARCLKGTVCERHGAAAEVEAPCIVDTDGEDYRDGLPLHYGAHCEGGAMLWQKRFNLLSTSSGASGFVDPRERTAAPTHRDFRELRRALR
jgi:hypothetical protein